MSDAIASLGQSLGHQAMVLFVRLCPEVKSAGIEVLDKVCAAMKAAAPAAVDEMMAEAKAAPWMSEMVAKSAVLSIAQAGIKAYKGAAA